MRKVIAAMNMSLDGYCNHTLGIPDEELHQHYTDLLQTSDTALYGKITYQLMEFWKNILENPSDNQSMNDFATAIDRIPKIVFSQTLRNTNWKTAKLAIKNLEETVLELRKQPGKDILIGSPGLIAALSKLRLIDEYQLCIIPLIAGSGLPLFKNIIEQISLQFIRIKTLTSGSVILYYQQKK